MGPTSGSAGSRFGIRSQRSNHPCQAALLHPDLAKVSRKHLESVGPANLGQHMALPLDQSQPKQNQGQPIATFDVKLRFWFNS